MAALCRRFGISRKTGYKWSRRAQAGAGVRAAESHRRKTGSVQRSRWWPDLIREKTRQSEWGAPKLRWQFPRGGRRGVPAVQTLHRWPQLVLGRELLVLRGHAHLGSNRYSVAADGGQR